MATLKAEMEETFLRHESRMNMGGSMEPFIQDLLDLIPARRELILEVIKMDLEGITRFVSGDEGLADHILDAIKMGEIR
jgi:hypothetical protein